MRRALSVFTFSFLICLVALPAQADRLAKVDGNDTSGQLDIARIVHKHLLGHRNVFVHKIVMQKRLRRRALHSTNQDHRRITVTFDVNRSKGYPCIGCITEREVLIFAKNGHIVARLYNHLGDPAKKLANLPVWRPNHRTVAFSVKRRQLSGKHIDFYDWGVESLYTRAGSSCPSNEPCFDSVPNHSYHLLRHQL
jgi:hypothetical protein